MSFYDKKQTVLSSVLISTIVLLLLTSSIAVIVNQSGLKIYAQNSSSPVLPSNPLRGSMQPHSPSSMNSSNATATGSNISGVQSTGRSQISNLPVAPMVPSGGPAKEQREPFPLNKNAVDKARTESESKTPSPSITTPMRQKQVVTVNLNQSSNATRSSPVPPTNATSASNFTRATPSLANTSFPSTTTPQITSSGVGFNGLNQAQGGGWTPPDVALAVGPNHVLQMVNIAGEIFSRGGTVIRAPFQLNPFFNAGSDQLSDPFLYWDPQSGRFFASILDLTTNSVRVAVSSTSDPTGSWNTFNFRFNACPDQPFIAVSSDKFAAGGNLFADNCRGGFVGAQDILVKKSDLLAGSTNPAFQITSPDPNAFSEHPVKTFGTDPKMLLVSVQDGNNQNSLKVIKYTGQVPNAQRNVASIPITITRIAPRGIQPDTTTLVATNDGRVESASMATDNNRVWITFNDACQPAGDAQLRSCVRLIQINSMNNQKTQDFDIGVRGGYIYFPALTLVSSGSLAVTFAGSSATLHPSLFATGQTAGVSQPNAIDPLITLKQGSAPNTSGRYGDYQGATIETDPSDPVGAWIAGEFNEAPAWSTFVTKLREIPPTITGIYKANDGGRYYVTQIGSAIWWAGLSNNGGGQSFTNVFRGNSVGNSISGEWADIPRGATANHGTIELNIVRNPAGQILGLHKILSTGGFSATDWEKVS